MKNTKKRGFTIVELVIVIAVIAILAAVLIPTFSNVINASKKSAAMQQARNAWTAYCADKPEEFVNFTGYLKWTDKDSNVYWFKIDEGQFKTEVVEKPTANLPYYELSSANPTVPTSTSSALPTTPTETA